MTDSPSPRLLTAELLEHFDQRLRDIDAPITRIWRPGLSDDQMDELTEPIGITLPTEARAWWRWHNGAESVIGQQPASAPAGISCPSPRPSARPPSTEMSRYEPQRPKAPSIGEVIHIWLEALDDGTWHIDPTTGDFALLDPTELLEAKGADVADLL